MKKKVLIIGNSAAAYSLAKNLSETTEVYVAPGSDGIKEFASCVDIREDSISELLDFVMENGIDMTIPVSQTAIEADIAEVFNKNNQQIFAPSKNASKLCADKALMKKVLYKLRIPTPKFGIFEKQNMVVDYIRNLKTPFVIKTNEPSSAVVFTSLNNAKKVLDYLFAGKFPKVIIEDYIWGTPFAFYALTDGYKALPFGSSILYKHSLEGEGGQLTGGMGACSPNYKLSVENEYFLMDNVIYPTLDYLEIEGNPYVGILGVNGILTEDGRLQILGYQTFTQNSDSAGILELIDTDLYSLFESCVIGSFSDEIDFIAQKDNYAVTVVAVCKNKENKENVINGLENLDEDTKISLYPSVNKNKYLEYEANSGSVLALTSYGGTVSTASSKVYSELQGINFNGMSYRKDICRQVCNIS